MNKALDPRLFSGFGGAGNLAEGVRGRAAGRPAGAQPLRHPDAAAVHRARLGRRRQRRGARLAGPAAVHPRHLRDDAPRPHLDAAPADRPGHAGRLQRCGCASVLAQGATAVSLIPCNSVFRGYDMDESHIELLGTCGTVVNTVEHMDEALAGVDLATTSCAMNDPSPFTLLAFMLAAARRRGTDWRAVSGHVQPERLPEPLRGQPHVLPHRAARRAAHPR